MPTRVLGIGTASNPRLRLKVNDESSPISPYVTLSHYKIQIEQVTKISQLTKGTDVNEFTRTFSRSSHYRTQTWRRVSVD
jgi:hypothetical protein